MLSQDQRYVISYNGEIYNTDETSSGFLNTEYKLRGKSDTEILLESIARSGLTETINKCVGMQSSVVASAVALIGSGEHPAVPPVQI